MTNTGKPAPRPFSLDAEIASARRVGAAFDDAFAALSAFANANPGSSIADGGAFLAQRVLTPRSKRAPVSMLTSPSQGVRMTPYKS
jgi:hypothetical protein